MQCKATHALLDPERCLIGLQQVPFQRLTNALLKSNQAPLLNGFVTGWFATGYELAFSCVSLYLQMIRLKLCNDFSKHYLYFQRIKMKRVLYRKMMIEWAVDCLGHVSVEWISSVLPLKLCEKHPRIERKTRESTSALVSTAGCIRPTRQKRKSRQRVRCRPSFTRPSDKGWKYSFIWKSFVKQKLIRKLAHENLNSLKT